MSLLSIIPKPIKSPFKHLLSLYLKQEEMEFSKLLDFGETISKGDEEALRHIIGIHDRTINIVEVGSWKGYSTSIMAKLIKRHGGLLFAIDTWKGSKGTSDCNEGTKKDIFSVFRFNMKILGLVEVVKPMVMTSRVASSIFKNESVDFVFIDGNHVYEHIREDILLWLPKIKDGGMIFGHDCEGHYGDFNASDRKRIDKNKDIDFIFGLGHCGVIRALYDVFKDAYYLEENSNIWCYDKHNYNKQEVI